MRCGWYKTPPASNALITPVLGAYPQQGTPLAFYFVIDNSESSTPLRDHSPPGGSVRGITTIPTYLRPPKRHFGHQCAKDQKTPKKSQNEIPEQRFHQIIESLTKQQLDAKIRSAISKLLAKRHFRVTKRSSIIKLLTKRHFRVMKRSSNSLTEEFVILNRFQTSDD